MTSTLPADVTTTMVTSLRLERLYRLRDARRRKQAIEAEKARKVDVFRALRYAPNPKQQVFHDADEFDVVYGGAAGGGKSKALVADDLRDAMRYPGIRIGAFRRTYDELAESLLKELEGFGYAKVLGATWAASKHELTFPNGSKVRYRYAETLDDASRRLGGEYQKLTIDERTLMLPTIVDRLKERLRSSNPAVPVIGVRSGTNPGGPGHSAVKHIVIESGYGEHAFEDDDGFSYRFIPAKVDDNPHVGEQYLRVLNAIKDPARRAAMRDGDWDSFTGQVFGAWRRDRHVVPRMPVLEAWRHLAGDDWGYTAPFCVLWAAIDEDHRVWVYREIYETQVGERAQARMIRELESGPPREDVVHHADPSIWGGRGEADSIADIWSLEDINLVPADNHRLHGWQRVHSYLADGPACAHHRALGWETCPKLHVLEDTCPNLVRTLPELTFDPKKPEDVDTHAEDHAADALRYLLMGAGEPLPVPDELAKARARRPVPSYTNDLLDAGF